MNLFLFGSALILLSNGVFGEIFFQETFDDDTWSERWKMSPKVESAKAGKMECTTGKFFGDEKISRGLRTSEDARFYAYSAKFDKPFDQVEDSEKPLVVQFSVKHEQKIDCGGGYIKVLGNELDPESFDGDSKYNIMFGPDICGHTKKVHVIFRKKENDENLLIKHNIPCETDQLTHVYTLIVNPDETYEVRIDGQEKRKGSLKEDWDFEVPKKIKDPKISKPTDWVDDEEMDDPEDTKPEDWDQPEKIMDPEAKKPEDWDDDDDGEWEAPMIDNPDFKGEWSAKRIKNPDYKGEWEHPEIDNPDYVEVKDVGKYDKIGAVGFDIWQVKSGTIFDNIIITDSIEESEEFLKKTFEEIKDKEKKAFEEMEAAEKAKEDAEKPEEPDDEEEDLEGLEDEDKVEGEDDKKAEKEDL